MDDHFIRNIVGEVIHQLQKNYVSSKPIPIAVSARHCHLSKKDLERLFGKEYKLAKKADLFQPGQFAANEMVVIVGPRGSINNVRVLGPTRSITQVEVSKTDAITLGLDPPLRESGNITGSSPVTIVGPKGSIYLEEGLIIAKNHIHMSLNDANYYQVKNGDYVSVSTNTSRKITFEKVLVRVSPSYRLEMHIDTDEANASFLTSGDTGVLLKDDCHSRLDQQCKQIFIKPEINFSGKILTEKLVDDCTETMIVIDRSTIVTPLAWDRVRDLKKQILFTDNRCNR